MHICDKCKKYNRCYPKNGSEYHADLKRTDVELGGCPDFRELTLKEMFFNDKR